MFTKWSFAVLILFTTLVVRAQEPFTIVIDAGHGGKDRGTHGKFIDEKEVVLDIALKLDTLLQLYAGNIKVLLTRDKDEFIALHERSKLANEAKADIFISLHCNHFGDAKVNGSEIYVMGVHTTEENLMVAKRENSAMLHEHNYEDYYDGYDPYSDEGHILLSFFQHSHLNESILFSSQLLHHLAINTKLRPRKVKQAGFVVLRQTAMPSTLVEIGFLSNHHDEQYLSTNQGRHEVANAILDTIIQYFKLSNNFHAIK